MLPIVLPRLATRLISGHGATDALRPRHLWAYLLMFPSRALPSPVVATSFFVASLMHFSEDIGLTNAFGMLVVCGILSIHNYQLGCNLISAYMCCIHVPMHYWRHCSPAELTLGLLASALMPCPEVVNKQMQLVIISHTVAEKLYLSESTTYLSKITPVG